MLDNELIWLQSLNCVIEKYGDSFIVKNRYLKSEDFNFIHVNSKIDPKQAINIMKKVK